ncbi:MAG: ATP-binding protein [Rhabdochlamydiaceae bacterium]|jgi:predicted AAA+ superfamily ATPase
MKQALSYEALRQVVVEQQEEIVHLRGLPLVERDKMKNLLDVLDSNWIKVVMGIRRCGKSILCHQALKDKDYGYLNFDDERLISLSAPDLNKMLQYLLEIKPNVKLLFFDEIQNVEGWELFVNRLQRQGYNLIITGSNSKLLSKELASHLTGRYIPIELSPFSFSEFLRAKKFSWSSTSLYKTQDRALLYAFLDEYLTKGGFPDMVLGGYNPVYLRELYDKIISRDITYRYRIKYSKTLKEIAIYANANLSSRLTFHKLKNIFEISSIHTVKNYCQYLTDAYLLFLLNAFSYKYKEQIKQPRKIYTIDNGLTSAISPKFTEDRGAALENLVFQELMRRAADTAYYGAPDCEIDFVILANRKVTSLIQVAFSMEDPTTRKREIKALIKAAGDLRCKSLSIITWEEEGIEEIDGYKIEIIPIWKWLLSISSE